jgi:hypothetical protein
MKTKPAAYRHLDDLALKAGTDKASSHHDYMEAYSHYFDAIKDDPIKFLEIGIYEGSSVKLWEEYFIKAELHFIDVSLNAVKYHSTRSHYHIARQEDADDLQKFIQEAGTDFDVIIDDGGHAMNQQITSFIHLFPHVKSQGIYIIEDLHTSYWNCLGGGNRNQTTIALLKNLIDQINFVGASTGRASHQNLSDSTMKKLGIYQKDILSICFYDSLVFVTKR